MDIRDLYLRKKNFPKYRQEQILAISESADAEKLKELRAHRSRVLAEIEAQIAQLKYNIALGGGTLSKSERKASRSNELTIEKREIDEAFAREVKLAVNNGRSVAEIARHCGADTSGMFYQALSYSDGETITMNIKQGQFQPQNEVWHYSDVTTVHRYAVNRERTVFRVHEAADPQNSVYVRRADLEVIAGDGTLAKTFNADRANLLIQLLDEPESVITSDLKSRANPYRGVDFD